MLIPTNQHGTPWLKLYNIQKFKPLHNRQTQQNFGLHSRHRRHICCALEPTRACLPKQATYQSDATTNKVHYSLSSPRDHHSPPWLKLLNAQLAKVLHSIYNRLVSRYIRLVNSRNIGKDNPKSKMI
jgi:hypothetical protein